MYDTDDSTKNPEKQACAEPNEKAVETHRVDTEQTNPQAQWQHVELPSARLAARIQEFEASADDPDPNRRTSSWLTGSGQFANGSDMFSMSHLTKRSDTCV